jgi:hypothetical protein
MSTIWPITKFTEFEDREVTQIFKVKYTPKNEKIKVPFDQYHALLMKTKHDHHPAQYGHQTSQMLPNHANGYARGRTDQHGTRIDHDVYVQCNLLHMSQEST